MNWQPDQQSLKNLIILLKDATNPYCREQRLMKQRIIRFNNHPDYGVYLVHILTKSSNEDINIRQLAGTLLNTYLQNKFNNIRLSALENIKAYCTQFIITPEAEIKEKVYIIISTIIMYGQLHNWINIIPLLANKLDDPSKIVVQTSLDVITLICENSAIDFDKTLYGIRPLQLMLPKFIQFYSDTNAYLRYQAIKATSQFIILKPPSFLRQLDNILKALYEKPIADENPQVRQEFSKTITLMLESLPEKLEPYLDKTIQYMINALQDLDDNIKLSACSFWEKYANNYQYQDYLLEYLPNLVDRLLRLMVYSEKELLDLGYRINSNHHHQANNTNIINIIENKPIIDCTSNLSQEAQLENKQRQEWGNIDEGSDTSDDRHNSQSAIVSDEDTDIDDIADDEFYSEDSVRECSAVALDVLSGSFTEKILPIILKYLTSHMLNDPDWMVKESRILALGASAEGGIEFIKPHLNWLIPYLLDSLRDPQPPIRSISCWTISRFFSWLVEQYDVNEESYKTCLESVLYELLKTMLDPNIKVQESSCTAVIQLIEKFSFRLVDYIHCILVQVNNAFDIYCQKNKFFLYDALGTLAETVKKELNKPQFLPLLMNPLIKNWNQLTDDDTKLSPVFRCLSNITAALGPGFLQFVDPVLTRCINLISSTLEKQSLSDKLQNLPPNVQPLIAALDLLSGIVRGLGSEIEPLIAKTNPPLIGLLADCINDPISGVLKSTFVLIGDIAGASFNSLKPYLHHIFHVLIPLLHKEEYMLSVSVYNNVLWSVGEIIIRWDKSAQLYVQDLVDVFIPLLKRKHGPTSVHGNAMIALGRLGLVSPEIVAPNLRKFIKPWLIISLSVKEDDEKYSAFRGFCAILKFNMVDAQNELYLLLVAIATFKSPSEDLLKEFQEIVKSYYTLSINEKWEYEMSQLDEGSRKKIFNLLK